MKKYEEYEEPWENEMEVKMYSKTNANNETKFYVKLVDGSNIGTFDSYEQAFNYCKLENFKLEETNLKVNIKSCIDKKSFYKIVCYGTNSIVIEGFSSYEEAKKYCIKSNYELMDIGRLKALIEVSNVNIGGNTNYKVICEGLIIDGFTSYSEAKQYCIQWDYFIINETIIINDEMNLMEDIKPAFKIPSPFESLVTQCSIKIYLLIAQLKNGSYETNKVGCVQVTNGVFNIEGLMFNTSDEVFDYCRKNQIAISYIVSNILEQYDGLIQLRYKPNSLFKVEAWLPNPDSIVGVFENPQDAIDYYVNNNLQISNLNAFYEEMKEINKPKRLTKAEVINNNRDRFRKVPIESLKITEDNEFEEEFIESQNLKVGDTYTVQFNDTKWNFKKEPSLQEILKDTSKLKRKINW